MIFFEVLGKITVRALGFDQALIPDFFNPSLQYDAILKLCS